MKCNSRARIIHSLSDTWMKSYLEASHGNEKDALALYRWHTDLTSSVQSVLGITEVVLRNAMDQQLQIWNNNQLGRETSWLLEEPATPLRSLVTKRRKDALRITKKEIQQRRSSHHRYGKVCSHDDVLAHLMFGCWKDLLPNHELDAGDTQPNRNRMKLWDESLGSAFPSIDDPDGANTFWSVRTIHNLRNRVSHMDSLLAVDIDSYMKQAFSLVRSIEPDTADWITGVSRVSTTLKQRPV